MNKIRIVNETGQVNDTKVYLNDVRINGLTKIVIDPIEVDKVIVTATLTIMEAEFDLLAEAKYEKDESSL